MDDLTREFLIESQEGLDRMERCLTDLEERPQDRELLSDIFRSVHTIKGTTGFLGFKRLEKLAHTGENLLGLLRDGKTGSGAFLTDFAQARYLAALLVSTAESAGTRTVALLTDMNQPLGSAAGNWIELAESVSLLRNQRSRLTDPLRDLCLQLAAWMLHLGGVAPSLPEALDRAERALADGSALDRFLAMVSMQGGDTAVFDRDFHQPAVTHTLLAPRSGYLAAQDTTALGWVVQRLGAGRTRPGEPVDPHAGIHFHARNGDFLALDQPVATLYASHPDQLPEAIALFHAALTWSDTPPAPTGPLVHSVLDLAAARQILSESLTQAHTPGHHAVI